MRATAEVPRLSRSARAVYTHVAACEAFHGDVDASFFPDIDLARRLTFTG